MGKGGANFWGRLANPRRFPLRGVFWFFFQKGFFRGVILGDPPPKPPQTFPTKALLFAEGVSARPGTKAAVAIGFSKEPHGCRFQSGGGKDLLVKNNVPAAFSGIGRVGKSIGGGFEHGPFRAVSSRGHSHSCSGGAKNPPGEGAR